MKQLLTPSGMEVFERVTHEDIGTLVYRCSQCLALRLRLNGKFVPEGEHYPRFSPPKFLEPAADGEE